MDVLEVLASGMTGFGWESAKACFNSWCSMDASNLSAISELSLLQSKARMMPPQMEMMPHDPGIFKTW
jgi:hypothetical protein